MMINSTLMMTVLTVTVLAGLIVISSISLHEIRMLSLPISEAIGVAAIFLPMLTGVNLGIVRFMMPHTTRSNGKKRVLPIWSIMIISLILVIYETVIATLALPHIIPSTQLPCGLDQAWGRLYSKKDERAIQRIQDAHQCCGLNTIKDRAWPFQHRTPNPSPKACAIDFHRSKSCLRDWKRDEQTFAGLLLVVAFSSFVLKGLVFFFSREPKSSIFQAVQSRYLPLAAAGENDQEASPGQSRGEQRRIESSYHAHPAVETQDRETYSDDFETTHQQNPSLNREDH